MIDYHTIQELIHPGIYVLNVFTDLIRIDLQTSSYNPRDNAA
jgi:hypothetical protein